MSDTELNNLTEHTDVETDSVKLHEEVVHHSLPVIPLVESDDDDDDEGASIDSIVKINTDYNRTKVSKEDVYLSDSGEILDRESLTPFDKLKIASKQIGQTINDPDPKCKKCYGRGYTGINLDGNIPQPCTCIYKEFYANNPDWRQHQMPSWNRKTRRTYEKNMNKYISLQSALGKKKYEAQEKSRANLGKNTPNFKEIQESKRAALAEVERLELEKVTAAEVQAVESVTTTNE